MTDSFKFYLDNIGKFPLLTPDQEIELSRRIVAWQDLDEQRKEITDPPPLTAAEKRVVRSGERARQQLINSNLRLVVSLARKYANRIQGTGLELADLCQEGCIGLARATEKFDGTRGYKFSTYAYWWIRQSISRSIDHHSRMIRIPTNTIENINRLATWSNQFHQLNGRAPSLQEMADHVERKPEELMMWFERSTPTRSLDALCHEDGSPLMNQIADTSKDSDVVSHVIKSEEEEKLNRAINKLTAREYDVLTRYYSGTKGMPLAHIGAELGICRERTRQIKNRALRKLRLIAAQDHTPPRPSNGLGHFE